MSYELDQLLGTYADWIAWLKEKEASLEAQLARMKGKSGEQEAESGKRAPVVSIDEVEPVLDESLPETEDPGAELNPSPVPVAGDDTPRSSVSHPPSGAESDDDDDWL